MKPFLLLLSLLFTLVQCECDNDPSQLVWELGIDVQSNFSGERVQIFIDQNLVSDSNVTTNHLLGVSDIRLRLNVAQGPHNFRMIVGDNESIYEEQLSIARNIYLGIQYEPSTHAITVEKSSTEILYD